jgi:chromate transporter
VSAEEEPLGQLAREFALLGIIAFGGVNTILPEMQRQAVEAHGWMSNTQFTQLFAIAQAAPGPNFMIVTLVGWQVAGILGALTATLALIVPTFALAYAVAGAWRRFSQARWRKALQAGLIPLTVGLVAAGAFVLSTSTLATWQQGLAMASTFLLVMFTRIHPLVPLAVAGVLGYLGFV